MMGRALPGIGGAEQKDSQTNRRRAEGKGRTEGRRGKKKVSPFSNPLNQVGKGTGMPHIINFINFINNNNNFRPRLVGGLVGGPDLA